MARCYRCNKQLWVATSVKQGYGPICIHKHAQEAFEQRAWFLWTQLQAKLEVKRHVRL
jgi:hypothetical protein